jgi:hypothetical protein
LTRQDEYTRPEVPGHGADEGRAGTGPVLIGMTEGFFCFPPGIDADAIAASAEAAPGGSWEAFADTLWIPWSAPGDDEPGDGTWCNGRVIGVREGDWHTGSDNPPPELWTFLAAARGDVLALAAEVRRLRTALSELAGEAGHAAWTPARGHAGVLAARGGAVPAAQGARS